MSGIYIHIPFCNKRCSYCDFYFITNTKLIDEYLLSLLNEIKIYSGIYGLHDFDTVFFGGGTPSILSPRQIDIILNELSKSYRLDSGAEISIEANPEDFTSDKFIGYKNAGINRISLGVQSFIDEELKFLTRSHSALQAEEVIKKSAEIFDNVSLDIIYSLPSQKISDIDYSVSKAVSLGIKHLSAYTLTFEEKTVMHKMLMENRFRKNTDEKESEFFGFISALLTDCGFHHYEVSNFAKKGFECRHNLKYWNYENYLGFGPSAHSLFESYRWNNLRSISKYIESLKKESLPVEDKYLLTEQQKKLEYLMLSLRSKGISFEKYKNLFQKDFETEYGEAVSLLIKNGFALRNKEYFRLNDKGYCIADEIIAKYF